MIQTNALIFSAFGQILAVLLRISFLYLAIETNALKFSSNVLCYSKSLNDPLPLLFVVFYKIQDLSSVYLKLHLVSALVDALKK